MGMDEQHNTWFLSFSGHKINPYDLTPNDIKIEDIAHSLSLICRFGGHCREFYSVAQHSVQVSYCVSQDNKLLALLHDATEAYIGDMVRPLKVTIPQYNDIERDVWLAICGKFNLPTTSSIHLPEEVDIADCRMLLTEKRDLLNNSQGHVWGYPQAKYPDLQPIPKKIHCWSAEESKRKFLYWYNKLN